MIPCGTVQRYCKDLWQDINIWTLWFILFWSKVPPNRHRYLKLLYHNQDVSNLVIFWGNLNRWIMTCIRHRKILSSQPNVPRAYNFSQCLTFNGRTTFYQAFNSAIIYFFHHRWSIIGLYRMMPSSTSMSRCTDSLISCNSVMSSMQPLPERRNSLSRSS
jgi:hypothetical protein